MIKKLGCLLAICILVLAGCGKEKTQSGTTGSVIAAQFCFAEDGLLLRGSGRNGKMEYFDYQTKDYYPLCGEPNCPHNSKECTAVYLADADYVGRFGDNWYYHKDSGSEESAFYSCSLDGKNEKRIGGFPHSCFGYQIFEDGFFFTATGDWFLEEDTGEVSENTKCGIYQYDLSTGKEELLVPEKESEFYAYSLIGKYQNRLVYYEEMEDRYYGLRILDLETKEITDPLEGKRIWRMGNMSENLLACNMRVGDSWSVIELDVKTGEWKEVMKDLKGSAGLFWSPKLKLLDLYDDSEGEVCWKTYQYQEDGACLLVREDREEYPFSPLAAKNDFIVGQYRGGNWQEGVNSELAIIGKDDYLAGKSDFTRLEY